MKFSLCRVLFAWICEKRQECTNPVGNSFHLHTPGNKRMENWVSYTLSTVVVTRWAFLLQFVSTVIPLIKERLSGRSFKISIFTTTPLKWKSVFEATESFFEEDVTVDDVDIGYVGKSNNKRLIKTDQHVDDAYTSRFNHKHSELVIYIEQKKRTRQARNGNYRPLGMVRGLFSFTSIVVVSCLCFF